MQKYKNKRFVPNFSVVFCLLGIIFIRFSSFCHIFDVSLSSKVGMSGLVKFLSCAYVYIACNMNSSISF